jgi:hypothetical protein
MIRNSKILQAFETDLIKREPVDIAANFRIADSLYREAVSLGVLPLKDPLQDLETITKVAKVVNSVPGTPLTHSA